MKKVEMLGYVALSEEGWNKYVKYDEQDKRYYYDGRRLCSEKKKPTNFPCFLKFYGGGGMGYPCGYCLVSRKEVFEAWHKDIQERLDLMKTVESWG